MGLFGRSESPRSGPGAASGGELVGRVDVTYALVGGLYVAALITPAALAFVVQSGIESAAAMYVAFLAIVTATTIGTAIVVRRVTGLPERLGRTSRRWAFAAVACVTAGGYLVGGELGAFPFETAVLAAYIAVLFGGLLGLLLAEMSRTRYVNAIVADEPVDCEWEAGWPRRWRISTVAIGLAMIVFGSGTVFVHLIPGGTIVTVSGGIAYVLGPAVAVLGQPWTYRIRPSGLERTRSVIRRLDCWDRIVAVEETETILVVRRRGWWRPPIHCARTDLDDSEHIRERFERYVSGTNGTRDVDEQ
ncbi:hypothetical protein [Halorhabdus salina]|uniref:hypothetical protein n=1 Tax=Halorhabdus salina TaxID=2750670 RepID=UPI0015EE3EB7|nr:hypothetical protein [Halorhabdus salina]